MKSSEKAKKASVPVSKDKNLLDASKNKLLKRQPDYYKKEKEILLDLSDAIIKVREKDDLIKVFASKLKGLFYFTHAVISLINKQNKTYIPFLLDIEALHIRHRDELPFLLAQQYFLDDPFIEMVSASEVPVSFLLKDIINRPGIPGFVKDIILEWKSILSLHTFGFG